MIIFQLPPCRLYPKICAAIERQYGNFGLKIHELFELKNDKFFNHKDNKLNITPKNFKFQRSLITYGIFDRKKIQEEKGDFAFTIRFQEEDIIKEFVAGINFYRSQKGLKVYDECFCDLMDTKFGGMTNEEIINFIKTCRKKDLSIQYKNIEYIIRRDILKEKGRYDYIGTFDDWPKTIEEIREYTGIDLRHLKNENVKAYK